MANEQSLRDILARHNNQVVHPKYNTPDVARLTVSFIIPVYNCEASIDACIDSIARQDRCDLIHQIIIINDASNDGTSRKLSSIIKHWSSPIQLIVINNAERRTCAFSRNRGLDQSEADVVCFIDGDIILPPNYVVMHVLQQQVQPCVCFSLRSDIHHDQLSGIAFPAPPAVEFRKNVVDRNNTLDNVSFQLEKECSLADLCLTCSVSYRRCDLIQVKGCPENFIGWGYNDTAIAAKVIALGRSVVCVKQAGVYHVAHPPRSGSQELKIIQKEHNRRRYERLLGLTLRKASKRYITQLEQ